MRKRIATLLFFGFLGITATGCGGANNAGAPPDTSGKAGREVTDPPKPLPPGEGPPPPEVHVKGAPARVNK
jgi:hypothetical protein